MDLLRPGGRLVILGYHYEQTVPVDPAQLVYRWLQIIASHNHSVRDVADAASLGNDGRIKAVISSTAPMREANQALAQLPAGDPIGRIVLQWGTERLLLNARGPRRTRGAGFPATF